MSDAFKNHEVPFDTNVDRESLPLAVRSGFESQNECHPPTLRVVGAQQFSGLSLGSRDRPLGSSRGGSFAESPYPERTQKRLGPPSPLHLSRSNGLYFPRHRLQTSHPPVTL